MEHNQAIHGMLAERYLLDELSPGERDAFEEHMFGCDECAIDVRATDAFMREAKQQLARFPSSSPVAAPSDVSRKRVKGSRWFISLRPAFALPAFAALLAVIAYQNFATIPHLRSAATEPRIMPWSPVHLGSRGGATAVEAVRGQGAVLLIQLPESTSYPNYSFALTDASGDRLWSSTVAAPAPESNGSLSLVIPSTSLKTSSYTLTVSGISADGASTEIDRRVLAIHFGP
ncbi:MAG TPA: zf-HC2 domain-containing protein [Terracidiphilus sp.]|nr:zf-HC2 domain-containing protein [Terracidiphilus sp.]